MDVFIKKDKVISTQATALNKESRICGIGRFVYPQLFESSMRLKSHAIRLKDGVRKATYEDAVAKSAEKLKDFTGNQFAFIAPPSASREEVFIMEKFTKDTMKSKHFAVARFLGDKVSIEPSGVEQGKGESPWNRLREQWEATDARRLSVLRRLPRLRAFQPVVGGGRARLQHPSGQHEHGFAHGPDTVRAGAVHGVARHLQVPRGSVLCHDLRQGPRPGPELLHEQLDGGRPPHALRQGLEQQQQRRWQ